MRRSFGARWSSWFVLDATRLTLHASSNHPPGPSETGLPLLTGRRVGEGRDLRLLPPTR
jgi:hypothetical protein